MYEWCSCISRQQRESVILISWALAVANCMDWKPLTACECRWCNTPPISNTLQAQRQIEKPSNPSETHQDGVNKAISSRWGSQFKGIQEQSPYMDHQNWIQSSVCVSGVRHRCMNSYDIFCNAFSGSNKLINYRNNAHMFHIRWSSSRAF